MRHLRGLGLKLLGLEHGAELAAELAVEGHHGCAVLLHVLDVEAEDHSIRFDGDSGRARDRHSHVRAPAARTTARWITSSPSTSPTATQRASAASLPAQMVSDSG